MDPMTHALAGQMIADALPFSGRLGEKAPLVAALAAMAPDVDLLPAIVAGFPPKFAGGRLIARDWSLARRFHRAYTHSFFFVTLASPFLGWLAWRWSGRRGHWLHWSILVLLALYSHIILDLTNFFGVRAWLPFSAGRPAWALLPLLDPPIIAVLLGVLFLNHVFRNSYAGLEAAAIRPDTWRKRTAGRINRLLRSEHAAWIGLGLIAARILAAAWL
ncbi:MAG: metal-dependent hydrolase [Planctomycetota bacterium]|jgi:inner membrane protein|nr:metal-dependent hydrolase [Planctomycetota bacterium]